MDGESEDLEILRFTLQDWQSDPERLTQAVGALARRLAHSVGYLISIDDEKLAIAHRNWVARCEFWQPERVKNGQPLSEMKKLALLLFQLASVDWVGEIVETTTEPSEVSRYRGNIPLWEAIRKGICSGPEAYFGLQFVVQVINRIERARQDRVEVFRFRLTPDLQHDILVYLHSDAKDDLALFLILKALYSRHGGRAN